MVESTTQYGYFSCTPKKSSNKQRRPLLMQRIKFLRVEVYVSKPIPSNFAKQKRTIL